MWLCSIALWAVISLIMIRTGLRWDCDGKIITVQLLLLQCHSAAITTWKCDISRREILHALLLLHASDTWNIWNFEQSHRWGWNEEIMLALVQATWGIPALMGWQLIVAASLEAGSQETCLWQIMMDYSHIKARTTCHPNFSVRQASMMKFQITNHEGNIFAGCSKAS